jgi:hypothetical protein
MSPAIVDPATTVPIQSRTVNCWGLVVGGSGAAVVTVYCPFRTSPAPALAQGGAGGGGGSTDVANNVAAMKDLTKALERNNQATESNSRTTQAPTSADAVGATVEQARPA